MRIYSKFNDYYDTARKYRYDGDAVYQRKQVSLLKADSIITRSEHLTGLLDTYRKRNSNV